MAADMKVFGEGNGMEEVEICRADEARLQGRLFISTCQMMAPARRGPNCSTIVTPARLRARWVCDGPGQPL